MKATGVGSTSGEREVPISEVLFTASRPRSRLAHWQGTSCGGQLLVTNGSRIFDVGQEVLAQFDAAARIGEPAVERLLSELGISAPDFVDDTPLQSPPLHALSLAVAQKCNLGCTYCYASQGDFGGAAKNMTLQTAESAVDLLIQGARAGGRVNLAFLGGEPLANREVIRSATDYASSLGKSRGIQVGFSITTNGTLLTESDADFF